MYWSGFSDVISSTGASASRARESRRFAMAVGQRMSIEQTRDVIEKYTAAELGDVGLRQVGAQS
jgi:hypothetical protein